ncbi:PTS sugar transporter subunit IIA [Bacillus circulans]|uniref:PTS sugar transporter subunit IIA n=1 Tax=Niallia circulans TaxID=1397 RepID=UPI001560AC71|nr:PTS sugar transporter subunit IIA [Niallia circulans]NRG26364.1 PTS sugar transporter subunit IIA [Niallia circulans]
MAVASFIKESLINIGLKVENQDELFQAMFEKVYEQGFVKETFLPKIKERESIFPTGLSVNNYSIAIPHTDPEHVVEQFIAVSVLEKPVSFHLMEDNTKTTEVQAVLMLGLNQPHSQIEVLQELMQVIQVEEHLEKLIHAKDKSDITLLFESIKIS